jgi:glycosyltransferase involved in cell wall biosynthesis
MNANQSEASWCSRKRNAGLSSDDVKISAILPCYNHARFLKERIQSVLAQTYPVSEIIFLDDASTDDSLSLAKSILSDTTIDVRYYVNQSNSGTPYRQWNYGVLKARHELVWIAETDDSCDPKLLQNLLYYHLKNNSTITFSHSKVFSENGEDLGSISAYTNKYWPNLFCKNLCIAGDEFSSIIMSVNCAIPNASSVIFQRAAYLGAGMADDSMFFAGDWDVWTRIARLGNVSFVSRELNYFRSHQLTTRAKGITPRLAAEHLACKINALFHERVSSNCVIDAACILQQPTLYQKAPIVFSWRASSLDLFADIYLSYKRIKRAPPLTKSAWIALVLVSYLSKVFWFSQRVVSCLYLSTKNLYCKASRPFIRI